MRPRSSEARPEDSGAAFPSLPSSDSDEPLTEDLAARSVDSRSFRVTTIWGQAWATILGLAIGGALFGFLHYVVPPSMSGIIDSAWFFALLVGGGMALGAYALMPRLAHSRLVAAPDGLYATVPSRFPRFTPWDEVRDFTFTDGKVRSLQLASGGRYWTRPPRRVSLWTPTASYSFECSTIENEYELAAIILEHRGRKSQPSER
jgi:hypothetical protein